VGSFRGAAATASMRDEENGSVERQHRVTAVPAGLCTIARLATTSGAGCTDSNRVDLAWLNGHIGANVGTRSTGTATASRTSTTREAGSSSRAATASTPEFDRDTTHV
jgi:hypothetical protein